MALAISAAGAVLARQADGYAVLQNGSKGKLLSGRPVNLGGALFVKEISAALEGFLELGVRMKIRGEL